MTAEVVVKQFNYAALGAEDRIVVQERTRDIQARVRKTSEMVVEIGQDLLQVRERLKQDALWMDWLDAELGWSHETARRYIQVAERFGSRTPQIVDFAPSVLYMLAAPAVPEAAVEEAITRAQAGAAPNVAATKGIIAAHRPPALTPLPPTQPPRGDSEEEEEEIARTSPAPPREASPAAAPARVPDTPRPLRPLPTATPAPPATPGPAAPPLTPLPSIAPAAPDREQRKHLVLRQALLEAALEATRAEIAGLPVSDLTWSVPGTTLAQAAQLFIASIAVRMSVASLAFSASEVRVAAPLGGDLASVVRRLEGLEDIRLEGLAPADPLVLRTELGHLREDLDDLAETLSDQDYAELATRCTAVEQWLKERA